MKRAVRLPPLLSQLMYDSDSDVELIMRRADQPRVFDEVTAYTGDHFNETASTVFDLLAFWHTYEDRYPKLSKLALCIFAIAASSAACERAFRRLKSIVTKNRESLSPETVSHLILSSCLLKHE